PVLKGHPLHAMLSDVPIGALITSMVMDAIWLANPIDTWRTAAEVALFVTVCGATLAALPGCGTGSASRASTRPRARQPITAGPTRRAWFWSSPAWPSTGG